VRSQWPVRPERVKASRDSPRQDHPSPNFYRILGVRPGADAEKIKAEYRRLARLFHPDINVGDAQAEQRTKDLNRAYETLADPQARAAYDAELARHRSATRGRFWRGVAAGIATFVLTASSLYVVTLAIPHSSLSRLDIGGGENERVAARSPQYDSAPSGAWGGRDVGSRDGSDKPASSSGPFFKSATATQQTPQQPVERQRSAPPEAEGVGFADAKPRASEELPARPTLHPEAPPREKVANAPSSVPPRREVAPPTAETPPTQVTKLAPPKIGDGQQPSPTVAMAHAAPKGKPAIWKLYSNARSGFALRYPADVFSPAGDDIEGKDSLLTSRDGRAVLRIFSAPHKATTTLTEYRQSLMSGRYAAAKFDYTPQRSNWFVLSGTVGEEMFYERITSSCDSRSIHGWVLVYPLAQRAFYDAIVEEIHRSYRYDLDASARCGERKSEATRLRKSPNVVVDMRQF
jgi:curved DNA-binding protein CbpA